MGLGSILAQTSPSRPAPPHCCRAATPSLPSHTAPPTQHVAGRLMARQELTRRSPTGHTSAAEETERAPQREGQSGQGRAPNGSQISSTDQPT